MKNIFKLPTTVDFGDKLRKLGTSVAPFSMLNPTFKDVMSVYFQPYLMAYVDELNALPDITMPETSILYVMSETSYKEFLQMVSFEDYTLINDNTKRKERHMTTGYDVVYSESYIDISKLPRYTNSKENEDEFQNKIETSAYSVYKKHQYHLVRVETTITAFPEKTTITELFLYIPHNLKSS